MKNISINFIIVNFYRDLRAGNLTLLLFSLIVAVSSISCISFLSDRVKQSLNKDMQSSLGADRRIVSDKPIPKEWTDLAGKLNISWALGSRFPSMVVHRDLSKLASIKAVTSNYPLKGQLEINTFQGIKLNPALGRDEVWVDPTLIKQLKLKIGDEIYVGNKMFEISGIVLYEPDRGINFVNFAPRVFINYESLSETGLIQVGSRVSYRMWLATDKTERLDDFDKFINEGLSSGLRVDTVKTARPDLNEALEKANSFLSLIGMVTMLMSAVSIALASRQLAQSKKNGFALMQVFGCDYRILRKISISELVLILVFGILIGCLIGFFTQLLLGWFLTNFSGVKLPSIQFPSFWIFFQALIIAVLLVMTFSWPSFHQVFKSNPISTLRLEKEKSLEKKMFCKENFLVFFTLVLSFLCMLYVVTKNLEMALIVSFGFLIIALLFFAVCIVFLKLISLLNPPSVLKNFQELNWVWINFKRAAKRRNLSISAQIIGLGISIAALATSSFIQNDLVLAWKNLIPDDAPNNFIINIQQDQKNDFKSFLKSNNIEDVILYPMVKARLIMINDEKLLLENYSSLSTRRLLKREINLSYGKKIPAHNVIVEGLELNSKKYEVSVEKDFAKKFDLRIGDVLNFDVAGEKLDVTVTSFRSLKWESMQVNFFMFLSEIALEDKPQSAITAFYLNPSIKDSEIKLSDNKYPSTKVEFKSELLKQFPNLTVVDTELIAKQVRRLITQSVFAVQFLFLFCLISGCLVLWACLVSSRGERITEVVLLRSLGASKRQIALAQWFELFSIGFLSGFLATGMAQILSKIVAKTVFSFDLTFNFYFLMIGGLIGALFALISGTFALKDIISTPTIKAMREIS